MPREKVEYRRTEIRFRLDDPLLAELEQETKARGVELQQHIYDLLRARYLARRGQAISDLLWIPGVPAAPLEVPQDAGIAGKAANTWLDMQGDTE